MQLDCSYDTDIDEEILLKLEEDILIVFMMIMPCTNLTEFFNSNELEDGSQTTVNCNIGANDILALARAVPPLFKVPTKLSIKEFDELCSLVCSTICDNVCYTRGVRVMSMRPMKLTPEQCLLSFIMYMKYDNVVIFESFG